MIYSVHENHRTVIIADIMTDKIINQLFQRDRLRKKKSLQLREGRKGSIIKRGDNVDSKSSVGDTGLRKEAARLRLLLEAKENNENTRWFERIRCEAEIIY